MMLESDGYASYVVAEGLDRNGEVLGTSNVFKTIPHPSITAAAVEKERLWLLNADEHSSGDSDVEVDKETGVHHETDGSADPQPPSHVVTKPYLLRSMLNSRIAACTVGFFSCATVVIVIWMAKRQRVFERLWTGETRQYERLDGIDMEAMDDGYQDKGEEEERYDDEGRPKSRESGELLRPQRRSMFLRSVS